MKNLFKKIIVLSIAMLMYGCSKDSPTSNAANCAPIACLNGGVSRPDCGCNCPQGYTGSNCGTQITPSRVTITKIRVKKFPDSDNGDWWDTFPSSDADIYVTLVNTSSTTIYTSPYFTNATGLGTTYYDFIPTTPITITNVTSPLSIELYDYENIGSDTLIVIDAARYFYGVPEDKVCITSVNASEHSVTCTGIFYYRNILESGNGQHLIDEYYSYNIEATKSTKENADNDPCLTPRRWRRAGCKCRQRAPAKSNRCCWAYMSA